MSSPDELSAMTDPPMTGPPMTDAVPIRPMTEADLGDVMVLEEDLFAEQAWSSAMLREELTDADTRWYVVAVDDADRVLGYAGLAAYDHEAHVLTIGTRPDHQRHGIGQTLLSALIGQATRRGVERIVLEVRADNAAAQRLYERNGFVVAGVRRRYYGTTDAVVMIRAQ